MIEPANITGLTQDCLIQQSRTCPGCYVETKDMSNVEASINLKMTDMNRDYSTCPISDINMQCMSTSETGSYGDQLLSDQLLSFPVTKTQLLEKKDTEKIDLDDPASKNLYESLLLDKCSGEDGLLTNPNQDWGYFESFISESKMELLDLCSKNELSVNLFSEEDVDNYMFDDDDDSTLSSDVCSLKIRYESFQDNIREKTNVLQEETQFNFFPSVLVNCTKKESSVVKRVVDEAPPKSEELGFQNDNKGDGNDSSTEQMPGYNPKMNYIIDSSNSADDSGEYSDESSSTICSFDTFQDNRPKNLFSRKNASCSNHLNYGLRAKRKFRFSDDYLYYVESTDGERNIEKREKPPIGPKQEEDLDWCPKKRRKYSRKDPPVIIKYIIVNRFKGDKCMAVKLGRIDSSDTTVSLNEDAINKYEKLSPLKDFWQEKQREREEQLKLAAGDKHNSHHHAFSSSPPKRKYKLANRLRIQRIQTVEQSPNTQGPFASDPRQEVSSTDETASMGMPLTIATSCASTLDSNDIIHTAARKSRSQEREERRIGNKIFRIHKFRSEARLRSKKIRDLVENNESMTDLTEVCSLQKNMDTVGGAEDKNVSPAAHIPHLCESQTANATEKFAFVSNTCSCNKESSSENVAASVSVIPGGYLQTLLDASDSSGSTGIPFFPQQTQHPLELSLEKQQFTSIQLAQSCVLSPPSESELQQSPQNCPTLTQMWQAQLHSNQQQFATADVAESAIQPNSFDGEIALPMSESLTVSGYSQLSLESNRMLYEKNYMPEQPLPPDAEFQACQGQPQFQRATLHTDNGRLISFDSVGSLSATSSNYSSLSLKSCEKDGEDDVNEDFLAHYSPKLVIQQSIDAITPLRESTDLLDISNFTPDKFRHASLSELSPPETPNLSPQVMGREIKIVGKATDLQDGVKMSCTENMDWKCKMIKQQDLARYSVEGHTYQLNVFNGENNLSLGTKQENLANIDGDMVNTFKGTKAKRRNSNKPPAGQGTKKTKAPKVPKTDKGKIPRQTSRTSKKLKTLLDEKGSNSQTEGIAYLLKDSSSEEWTGIGCSESKSQVHDDQREFEEPSNILSNIVSGMAEVQRFMMASVEPIWGPAANVSLPSEANSLKLKTLKILAGTSSDPKKKGTLSTGGTKGRKGGTKGVKNQAKFNASLPFFPQLALGCNMFDKPNLGVPGINGPAHKKMYRHKTSAKFPRIENLKGTRPEREPNKDISLMASFEKLR
ncbi:neurite extension and migration factor [Danio aesculapii]|uniref:neurite extension and migration factor n=1 Tax=Danio aesculapii TaxID=1142201 RepID=UPI0024C033A1|nr:neurite extension and migration factor [Danio aesculapii]